jgi:hypothetical protein
MTVPRMVASGRLSPPIKWFNKNVWREERINADIAKLLEQAS